MTHHRKEKPFNPELLIYFVTFYDAVGYPPTYRDMIQSGQCGIGNSTSLAGSHVKKMTAQGYLCRPIRTKAKYVPTQQGRDWVKAHESEAVS